MFTGITLPATAAPPQLRTTVSDYSLTERGKALRIWSRVTSTTLSNGRAHYRTNIIREVGSGMHYRENGQWFQKYVNTID